MIDPYRITQFVSQEATGHPIVDQVQGILVDPGHKVVVYEKDSNGTWRGSMRIVVRSSRTHLEHKCPILGDRDLKITTWGSRDRWL